MEEAAHRLAGKWYNMHLNMSGEMHMLRRNDEVFGCIPHGARAYRERDFFTMGSPLYYVAYQ